MLSFDRPVPLNTIVPVAAVESLADMRRFPTGDAMYPERDIVVLFPAMVVIAAVAITEVPSHNFANTFAIAAVETVIVPLTNHVPEVPCATLGPS